MFNKISQLWQQWSEKGLHLPFVHDGLRGKPSVTLLFVYLTFLQAFISVILLHIWPVHLIIPTTTSILFFVICSILYRMRHLDKMKMNLAEGTLELDNDTERKTND